MPCVNMEVTSLSPEFCDQNSLWTVADPSEGCSILGEKKKDNEVEGISAQYTTIWLNSIVKENSLHLLRYCDYSFTFS